MHFEKLTRKLHLHVTIAIDGCPATTSWPYSYLVKLKGTQKLRKRSQSYHFCTGGSLIAMNAYAVFKKAEELQDFIIQTGLKDPFLNSNILKISIYFITIGYR